MLKRENSSQGRVPGSSEASDRDLGSCMQSGMLITNIWIGILECEPSRFWPADVYHDDYWPVAWTQCWLSAKLIFGMCHGFTARSECSCAILAGGGHLLLRHFIRTECVYYGNTLNSHILEKTNYSNGIKINKLLCTLFYQWQSNEM